MIPDTIERKILIHASPERVWAALTEAGHLGSWFGDAGAEIELEPGGRLELRWEEHGTSMGIVEEVEYPHRFGFRWSLVAGEPPRPGNSTRVQFTLEARGEGSTWLHMVESGFRSLQGDAVQRRRHLDANTSGWKAELAELRDYLAPLPA